MCGYKAQALLQRNPIDSRISIVLAGLLVLCNLGPGMTYTLTVGDWSQTATADAAGTLAFEGVPESGTVVLESGTGAPHANGCEAEGRE